MDTMFKYSRKYLIDSGLGGAYTVKIEKEIDRVTVLVRVLSKDFDGLKFKAKRSELRPVMR